MKIFVTKSSRLKDEAGVRVQLASVLTLASDLRLCPRLGAGPLLSEPPRPPHRLLQRRVAPPAIDTSNTKKGTIIACVRIKPA